MARSATKVQDAVQADGRRYIRERFVDASTGAVSVIEYLADAAQDTTALRQRWTDMLDTIDASREGR